MEQLSVDASNMEKTVDFWFEFASPYSYPAAMRIEELARAAGVTVRWRVFLLGAVFAQYGWKTTPDQIFPAKGNYMWLDMQRICQSTALPYQKPTTFPRNGLLAARIAANFADQPWIGEFVRSVYTANFAEDQDIASQAVIEKILQQHDLLLESILAEANSEQGKNKLKQQTSEALQQHVFGAPFMLVGSEPFWGNDRLEQAIYYAAHGKLPVTVTLGE